MATNKIRLKCLVELEKKFGTLRARDLVEAARNRRHPLHNDGFIWDDAKAAEEHRLDRARQIIALTRTVATVNHVQIKTVAYVRDPSAASNEQGYVSVNSLRSDRDRALEALSLETSRVQSILERSRELADALDLRAELESMLEGVISFSSRLRRGPANPEPPEMRV